MGKCTGLDGGGYGVRWGRVTWLDGEGMGLDGGGYGVRWGSVRG